MKRKKILIQRFRPIPGTFSPLAHITYCLESAAVFPKTCPWSFSHGRHPGRLFTGLRCFCCYCSGTLFLGVHPQGIFSEKVRGRGLIFLRLQPWHRVCLLSPNPMVPQSASDFQRWALLQTRLMPARQSLFCLLICPSAQRLPQRACCVSTSKASHTPC